MSEVVIHPHARCCWCTQPLVCVDAIWWCPTAACRLRQREYGVGAASKKGGWRWFFVPTPKQVELMSAPEPYLLFGGAAGAAKSHGARWMLYRECLQPKKTPMECLLLRETFPELERTHLRRMAQEAPLIGAEFIPSRRLMQFPDGSLIECGHMDDDAAVQRYLSAEYDRIVPDEGVRFKPGPLLELSTRTVKRRTGGKYIIVTNPGGPSSQMLLDFFIDHEPDFDAFGEALRDDYLPAEWRYIEATLDDNPYLDPSYAKALAILPKARYEQLRHANWRVHQGQFFGQWNERTHIVSLEPSRDGLWFRSMDWGRNQPGCVIWWTVLPDHQLYIRKDWKFQGMDEQEVAKGIKAIDAELGLRNVRYTAADPAIFNKTGATHQTAQFVGQSIGESLNHYGLKLVKADNDRFNGWGRCHALLRPAPDGTPWLRVHPDARYLTRSIPNALSDKKDPDDVDTTQDDHALDAWRYGAMSRPHPLGTGKRQTRFAEGTMGHLRQSVSRVVARLGSESVRSHVA